MDIVKAFNLAMEFEGGAEVVNILGDRGGLTKYGISKTAYPNLDIANLTKDDALRIYQRDYWTPAGCELVKNELRYIIFDTAINMGVATAIKLLQEASNIKVDGILGADTLKNSINIAPTEYLLFRATKYNHIIDSDPSQLIFRKGWINRIAEILKLYKTGQLR